MNIYTNTSFEGHFPVGAAAVVRAKNAEEAAKILNAELRRQAIPGSVTADKMELLSRKDDVLILNDGNY